MTKKSVFILCLINLSIIGGFMFYGRLIHQVDSSSATMTIILIFCGLCCLLASIAFWLMFVKNTRIDRVFLIVCLSLGIISGLVNAPGAISDEYSHVKNVYLWSNRILGVESNLAKEQYSTVYQVYDSWIRAGDADLFTTIEETEAKPTRQTYLTYLNELKHSFFSTSQSSSLVAFQLRDHSVSPFSYFPAIFGVTLARILHLGIVPLLLLARFLMLLFYAGCIAWAIRKIPTGKIAMFMTGLLPMAINLAPSFSYDPVITAVAMMLIAQLFAMMLSHERVISAKDMIITGILVFFLSPFKLLVYLPIIIVILIMPKTKFPARLSKGSFFFLTFFVGLLSVAISNLSTFLSVFKANDAGTASSASYVSQYTVGYVFSHPLQILKMMVNTTIGSGFDFFVSMIGRRLTSDNVIISYGLILCFGILLVFAAIRESEDQKQLKLNLRQRALLLLPLALCYLFFLVGMLFWWTEPNAIKIHGIQGRYFIPVLPLVLFAFSPNRVTRREGTWRHIAQAAILLEILVLASNFAQILIRV
jgi:uncharacterized membrane protein